MTIKQHPNVLTNPFLICFSIFLNQETLGTGCPSMGWDGKEQSRSLISIAEILRLKNQIRFLASLAPVAPLHS